MNYTGGPASRSRPRENLKDEVARYVRDSIFSGAFRPGTKIDQDAVAIEMGVSKLPVREALIALASEGILDNLPRRGAFVAELTPDDIRDHYAIFGLVSGLAAERAAEQITDEQVDELEGLVAAMAEIEDLRTLGEMNEDFHEAINRIGTTKRLRAVIRLLADALPTRFFETTDDWPSHAHDDHQAIVTALREHDSSRAAEQMNQHLRSSGEYAVRMLKDAGYWLPATSEAAAGNGRGGSRTDWST